MSKDGHVDVRAQGGRFAWSMSGAAIASTVLLLVAVLVPTAAGSRGTEFAIGVVGALLLGTIIGLVPGVRELEVTGARMMLGSRAELVAPRRPRLLHRAQTVGWVLLHLGTGLASAACLVMVMPAGVVTAVEAVGGSSGTVLDLPVSGAGRIATAVLATLAALGGLLAWALIGMIAVRLAPLLLGPTSRDLLEIALARADREAEHTRIARELHDGIGHALSIVSIQAAAGGRVLMRDPASAGAALQRIEATARYALQELDAVLSTLRAESTAPGPPADPLQVVREHRRAGMDITERIDLPDDLALLQRGHLTRILAELLANAHRHGAPGQVRVDLRVDGRRIHLDVKNPLAADAPPGTPAPVVRSGAHPVRDDGPDADGARAGDRRPARSGGRGLTGMRERVSLFGGTLEAGPQGGDWIAHVDLPTLREEG